MRCHAFCAYGAQQVLDALPVLERPPLLDETATLRRAAVRLQACLTLFYPCYPPTRVAFWKRRLRRLIRALNALRDCQRLLTLIPDGRVHLRLQQRVERLFSKAQLAWRQLRKDYVPNEIRGLSQRLAQSSAQPVTEELLNHARARWQELARVNREAFESEGQSLEDVWGRLQLMAEVAEMLQPLLGPEIPLDELRARYSQLDDLRFCERARALLIELKEQERALTLHYHGSLRGFKRIEQEFDRWIAQFSEASAIHQCPR